MHKRDFLEILVIVKAVIKDSKILLEIEQQLVKNVNQHCNLIQRGSHNQKWVAI